MKPKRKRFYIYEPFLHKSRPPQERAMNLLKGLDPKKCLEQLYLEHKELFIKDLKCLKWISHAPQLREPITHLLNNLDTKTLFSNTEILDIFSGWNIEYYINPKDPRLLLLEGISFVPDQKTNYLILEDIFHYPEPINKKNVTKIISRDFTQEDKSPSTLKHIKKIENLLKRL